MGEAGVLSATYQCTVTIQRNPAELEAVIDTTLPPNVPLTPYENWEPLGGPNEDEPGATLLLRVLLRPKGSQTTDPAGYGKARFRFHLNDVSREPGVGMNFPPKARALVTDDLRFGAADTLLATDGGLTAETVRDDLSQMNVVIESFDYGAYGKLTVIADIPGQGPVTAFVLDHPDRTFLTIPKDENDNHVADPWEKSIGVFGWSLAADWDKDTSPGGQKSDGDGLSFYEEYRGFQCKGRYSRLMPQDKDFFVYDPDGLVLATLASPGLPHLLSAADLVPHLIYDREWTGPGHAGADEREVNFNTSGFAHVVDQHGTDIFIGKVAPTQGDGSDQSNQQPATTYPDDTFSGPGGPGDSLHCIIRPWVIANELRREVRYHTRGLPLFAGLDDPSLSDQDKQALKALLEQATDEFIEDHPTDYARALQLRQAMIVTHELCHTLNTTDHAPLEGGSRQCLMRYLPFKDYARDPSDRFCLSRRNPWPSALCTSGDACRRRIQVSDFAGGAAPAAAASRVMSAPASTRAGVTKSLGQIPYPHEPEPPLALGVELGWNPSYAGDPLQVTVRLSALNTQQAQLDWLESAGSTSPDAMAAPTVTADWPQGVTLELVRLGDSNQRQVIIPAGSWATSLRPPGVNFDALGARHTVRNREWLVPAAAAGLSAGTYELRCQWNGLGWAPANRPPGFTNLTFPPIGWTVLPADTDVAQATHLKRLALVAHADGQWTQARSFGESALDLTPDLVTPEALELRLLTADAASRQQDYGTAYQLLSLPGGANLRGELAGQVGEARASLSPRLTMQRSATSVPVWLSIAAQPGQHLLADYSLDARHWTPWTTNVANGSGEVTLTDLPESPVNGRFYRARWQP